MGREYRTGWREGGKREERRKGERKGRRKGKAGGKKGRGERTGRFCRTHMVIPVVQPRAPHTKDA